MPPIPLGTTAGATTTTTTTTPPSLSPTHALLQRAHSSDTAAQIFSDKIQYRSLYLRPSSPPPAVLNARDARRRARTAEKARRKALRPKPLSSRQRRALGLHEVPRRGQQYANFKPLHRLWLGYIQEVLGMGAASGAPGHEGRGEIGPGDEAAAAAKLASADMHGAEMEVVRSGCVSRVGIKGIVTKDAKFVFELVTKKNRLKVVPKEGTIFRVKVPLSRRQHNTTSSSMTSPTPDIQEVEESTEAVEGPQLVFEIHGDQFMHRSADRANRKFKQHFLDKL